MAIDKPAETALEGGILSHNTLVTGAVVVIGALIAWQAFKNLTGVGK